ncbi:MAG: PQQ-dependent sugar dehydrogenase [Rhodospirillales bacterium]
MPSVRRFAAGIVLLGLLPGCAFAQARLSELNLPDNLAIEEFARVPSARTLIVVPELDAMFVGSRGNDMHVVIGGIADSRGGGEIYKVPHTFRSVNGLAWHKGALYIAEQHRVLKWPLPDQAAIRNFAPVEIFDGLPDKRHHGWRYAAVGPDEKLYIGVGAPCNICAVDGLEGTITRMNLDGSDVEVFARGIRNTVGLAFHPETGVLYFTDNGADNMGDDSPPEELNRAPRAGLHFGYPYYGGGADRTPQFRNAPLPDATEAPVATFGAHQAPLGVHHYRGTALPEEYRRDAFVALHGSWNRTQKAGYRVMRVRMDGDGNVLGTEVFIDGWLRGETNWGRPVDIDELPDGSMLISDDYGGRIYRVSGK